jgi:hypothetical protein
MSRFDHPTLEQTEETFAVHRRTGTAWARHYTVRVFSFPPATGTALAEFTNMATAFHVGSDGEGEYDLGHVYGKSAAEVACEIGIRIGEDFERHGRQVDYRKAEEKKAIARKQRELAKASRAAREATD